MQNNIFFHFYGRNFIVEKFVYVYETFVVMRKRKKTFNLSYRIYF